MKMRFIVISCLLVLLLSLENKANAQISLYRDALPDGNLNKTYSEAKNNKNELETAFSGLFLFYKTFISSQDLSVCTFTPSCSEYGLLAIKHYGLVKGGVFTIDRLTRCNGLSPKNYELDQKTMLLKDDPTKDNSVPIVSTLK